MTDLLPGTRQKISQFPEIGESHQLIISENS